MALSNAPLILSILLRVVGVSASLVLLFRVGDRRFAYLTMMLALMALRQIFTLLDIRLAFAELPGLVVSGLAVMLVYYLFQYTQQEEAIKSELQERNETLRGFREAIEHAGHAIYITDVDGTIQYVNSAFTELTGYSRAEAVGSTPEILHSGENPPEYYGRLWETILSGDVWSEQIVNQRKDGGLYTAYQTIAPVQADSDVQQFVAIQTDITDRELRDQRLSVLHRVLRHNLRNELTVILGTSQTLRHDLDGTEYEDDVQTVLDAAERLEELSAKAEQVDETLQFARENHERKRVSDLLEQVVVDVEELHPDASVIVDVGDDPELFVSLQPAFEELVENGIEHNDSDTPTVEITVRTLDDEVEICVADNGSGIPEQERKVLQTGEETPLIHGSGLGLWLIYWLAKISGGAVEIRDAGETAGTVVILRVPDAVDRTE